MAILTGELLVVGRNGVAIAAHPRYTVIRVRKPEEGVVEDRAQPCRIYISGVATDASRWIICRHVIRHARAVSLRVRVIGLMAAVAIRGRIARSVVAPNMTIGTRIHHGPDRAGNRRARR